MDRTVALETGQVCPVGANLQMRTVPTLEAALSLLIAGVVDCAEVPLIALFDGSLGDKYEALPVFPNRASPAYAVFGNKKVQSFEDLTNNRIWAEAPAATTMGVWIQVLTGVAVDLTSLEPGTASDAIQRNDADFAVLPSARSYLGLVPTFENPSRVEDEMRKRVGGLPILSVVVVNREVMKNRRWLPVALTDAFVDSKELSTVRHEYFGALSVGLPWLMRSLEQIKIEYGGDAYPYGLGRNREMLTKFAEACPAFNGPVDALFAPESVPLTGIAETTFYAVRPLAAPKRSRDGNSASATQEKLQLTYGGLTYLDRNWALQVGEVEPEGIDLNYAAIAEVGSLFRRMAQFAEFDVAEMSLSTLIMLVARGDKRLVGLPVFPSRTFRHAFLYVRDDSGIEQPKDLIGKRVGVQDYQATAYVWQRALLQNEFGVAPGQFSWHVGGLDVPSPLHRMSHDPPPGVEILHLPPEATLEGWLREGELDAVFTPEDLISTSSSKPNWHRLFPDYERREREFFAQTGFFPIMHCVVMRREVYEKNPWIAANLFDAFQRSKDRGYARMRDLSAPALTLPDLPRSLSELDEIFNGDAFPYGYTANARILEAITQYSFEQGLAVRKVDPKELFAAELMPW